MVELPSTGKIETETCDNSRCASLRTPHHVTHEWAKRFGLDYFTSDQFINALDTVCDELNVHTNIQHNSANQVLLDGCAKLGIDCEPIPQNTAGCGHECGWCTYGCPKGDKGKQSSIYTWLKRAQQNGAKFIQNCKVERILHKDGLVHGVESTCDGVKVFVKAKVVVCSAGAINTPVILKKSGLRNLHLGKHLWLHPCSPVVGTFDREIKQYEGSIMTAVSKNVMNVDGNNYGCLIEVPTYHPAIASALGAWNSMYEYKKSLCYYNNQSSLIPLTRDFDSEGSVYVDSQGNPRILWKLSNHDAKSLLCGVEQCIRILIAAGARKVSTSQNGVAPFVVPLVDPMKVFQTSDYQNWIKYVKAAGIKQNYCNLASAHQMGTCRMGTSSSQGVCSPQGETFQVKNLFVADASVFPTATGVNPMISVYAVSWSIAQFIKQRFS